MTVGLPTSLPPADLHDKVLVILLSRLRPIPLTDSAASLPLLRSVLQILAYRSLHLTQLVAPPLHPLHVLLALSESSPTSLPISLLLDATIAYPLHVQAINTVLARCFDTDPSLIEQVEHSILPLLLSRIQTATNEISIKKAFPAIRTLLTLIRAHEELLGLVLGEADVYLPVLVKLYSSWKADGSRSDTEGSEDILRVKQDSLSIVHELISAMTGEESKEMIKRLLGSGGLSSMLVANGLRGDYEAVFERGLKPKEDVMEGLRRIRRRDQGEDPRLPTLVTLFPHIPARLLREALAHPFFSSTTSTASPEEGAAPLVEAILSGGANLPDDLAELRAAASDQLQPDGDHVEHDGSEKTNRTTGVEDRKKLERRNIWDGELDLSKLRIKDSTDTALPQVASIPDHLRESILRLVQSQAEEEEERERAVAEAHSGGMVRGEDPDEEETLPRVKISGEGDNSDAEEGEGDTANVVDKTRRPSQVKTYDPDLQSKLELAYLANPAVFDRDGQTRRSDGRRKLKDATGMDDGQLEGWKIMLERSPHKDAILARHQFIPPNNKDYLTPPRSDAGSSSSRGSRGGRGGRGGGGGSKGGSSRGGGGGASGSSRGGSEGGSSRGGGGGGDGGGRGQNKGSRGHSNAARTRGHDRKMTRMGAGA